jgi:LytTr DNA-binding domain
LSLSRRDAAPMALAAIGPLVFCAINIWSRLYDAGPSKAASHGWEIITWEVSSAAITLLLIPVITQILLAYPLSSHRKRGLTFLIHTIAGLGFWVLHVSGFVLIRLGVYALHDSAYRFGEVLAWLYELPKDLVSYAILAIAISAARAFLKQPISIVTVPPPPLALRDGKHCHFIDPHDIVAVNAAGNYLQIHTIDGRTPLVRSTMDTFSMELPADAFLRAHRSWLVNRRHVVKVVKGRTFELHLARQMVVPVSRRFRSRVEDTLIGQV